MRNIPELSADFDAAHAAVNVYSTTTQMRRSMRAQISKTLHGWHPSAKMGLVEYEGLAQAGAVRMLDLRDDIDAYLIRSIEIRFSDEGQVHSWVPDIGIRFKDDRKAVLDLLSRDEAAFFHRHGLHNLMSRALRERGISYVAREHAAFAASRPCLNAAYALRFRVAAIAEALALRIEDLLVTGRNRTLSDLCDLLAPATGVLGTACAMAWAGRLALGLNAPEPLAMSVSLAGASR